MEFLSDLVLLFLPMSHKKDARLIWVNSLPPGKFFLTSLLWADFFEIDFSKNSFSVKQFGSRSGPIYYVEPDLGYQQTRLGGKELMYGYLL